LSLTDRFLLSANVVMMARRGGSTEMRWEAKYYPTIGGGGVEKEQ
jgi:hypothetical protein